MLVAEKHRQALPSIKKDVTEAYEFFRDNYRNFSNWMRFIFVNSMSDAELSVNSEIDRPSLQFNICEQYIARQRGEFAAQEPSVLIQDMAGVENNQQMIDLLQNHSLHILAEAERAGVQFKAYTYCLGGGFAVFKLITEYIGKWSFQQVPRITLPTYPTLCFFDPTSREPHKADGRYCGEWIPMPKEQFISEYPNYDISSISFTRSTNSNEFNWSYKNGQQDFIMVCDYYYKKKVPVRIIELSNGEVIRKDRYELYAQNWRNSGKFEQVPIPKNGHERWEDNVKICRYRFIEGEVLSHEETIFESFPLVFVDGNSVDILDPNSGSYQQVTRSYCHQIEGAQKLTNLSGQMICNELETSIQHKWMIMKEAIPVEQEYLFAYQNVQKANLLVWNGFDPNDSSKPLAPPTACPRQPMPQEFLTVFSGSTQLMQSILGNYDAALGANDNDLSGKAMLTAQTQSNTSSTPNLKNYMLSLTQILNALVEIFPKLYKTPYTMPIKYPDGSSGYQKINQDNTQTFDYEPSTLKVEVNASASFNTQKVLTLQQITAMMQADPTFAQFISQNCLDIMVGNMNCLQQDELKKRSQQFMQQVQQQAQQAAQNPPQNPMVQIKMTELQQKAQDNQAKNQIAMGNLQINKQNADTKQAQVMGELQDSKLDFMVRMDQASAEKARAAADEAMNHVDLGHKHAMDIMSLHQAQSHHEDNIKNGVEKNVIT